MRENVKTLKEISKAENAIETLIALEGFEKELREMHRINFEPTRSLIKEILGEN